MNELETTPHRKSQSVCDTPVPYVNLKVQQIWNKAQLSPVSIKPKISSKTKSITERSDPWVNRLNNFKVVLKDLKLLGNTYAINMNHIKPIKNSFGSAMIDLPILNLFETEDQKRINASQTQQHFNILNTTERVNKNKFDYKEEK